MTIEATEVEQVIGCGSFSFKGSPTGVRMESRIYGFCIDFGIISTGGENGYATFDRTTERSITVSYPEDTITAKPSTLPVGATGTLQVEIDGSKGPAYNQTWVKVAYSKVVRGIVYHRFIWVEAPE